MQKNTATIRVGRLVEIRTYSGYRSVTDVDALFDAYFEALATLPANEQVVTIVDHRHAPMMSREAAGYLAERLSRVNSRTFRAANLIPPGTNPTGAQYEHIVRTAGGGARRTFSSVNECVAWLSEVLNPLERQRLVRFLDEGEHALKMDNIHATSGTGQRAVRPGR